LLCLFYHLSSSEQYGWSPFMRWQISIRLHLEVKTANQYFWLRNEVEVDIHVNTGLKVNRSSQRFQTTSASLIQPMKLYLLTQLLFCLTEKFRFLGSISEMCTEASSRPVTRTRVRMSWRGETNLNFIFTKSCYRYLFESCHRSFQSWRSSPSFLRQVY
jgi:hypothetical protein